MENLKKFYNYIIEIFSKIPTYLRGLFLFLIVVLLAMLLNKFFQPNYNNYIRINEPEEINIIEIEDSKELETSSAEVINYKKSIAPLTTRRKDKKEAENLTSFESDYIFGDKEAPITIIEFSNYECPFCLKFHKNIMSNLKKEYIDTGKVKYIKRMIIQTDTLLGVMLPYCAREENKYTLVEDLYNNVSLWTNRAKQEKELKKIALRNGFTEETYKNCIKDSKLAQKLLDKQQKDLKELRIYSTPTIFINNNMLRGKLAYEDLKKEINAKLKNK